MKQDKIKFILPMIVIIILIIIFKFVNKETLDDRIKIGVGDDISGILLNYMIEVKGLEDTVIQQNFESYSIVDCCTNTSQWALSSGTLDIAVICPNAAQTFLEKDDRFEVIGPSIINSDIFVTKSGVTPKTIGVTQNRHYQERLVKESFGEDVKIVPMLTNALPYTYAKDVVDGIVIDVIRGLALEGDKTTTATKGDNTSYVLVVRKEFTEDARYKHFIRVLEEAVYELNEWEVFSEELERQKNIRYSEREAQLWQLMETRFIFPGKALVKDSEREF